MIYPQKGGPSAKPKELDEQQKTNEARVSRTGEKKGGEGFKIRVGQKKPGGLRGT